MELKIQSQREQAWLTKDLVKSKEEKIAEEKALVGHRAEVSKEKLAGELRKDAYDAFVAY